MHVFQEEKDRGCDTEHQQNAYSIINDLHTRKNAEYELINHDDSYSAGSLGTCSSLDEANSKKLLDKTRKSCAEDGKEKESSSKEDVANADYEGVDKRVVNEKKSGTEDGKRETSPSDEGHDSSSESSDEGHDSSSESSDEGNDSSAESSDEDNDSSSKSSDEDKATEVGSSVSEKVEVVSYFCLSTSFA